MDKRRGDSRSRIDSGGRKRLKRSTRLQLKAAACVLGILLLAFLLGGQILLRILKTGESPEPERPEETAPHIPVVQELHNVWIMEDEGDGLLIFQDGQEERYPYALIPEGDPAAESVYAGENEAGENAEAGGATEPRYRPAENIREQVADVVLSDGAVSEVRLKKDKICGTVLSADESSVEVEGYGRLPLADNWQGYRIFNTLAMCTQRDLAFGYDFTDLVMEDGKVCGLLMAREEAMQDIRVLIRTADFEADLHRELTLTADTDFAIRYGGYEDAAEELHEAGEEVEIATDSAYFLEGRVSVIPSVCTGRIFLKNVRRSQGVPGYRGRLELTGGAEGFAVVNVLPLEEYLYSVVPSEMPASYPREALRAQAVSARTYAYGHMLHAAYPAYGAHVGDSSAYQVYNNISEQERSTTAVKETYGQLLYTEEGTLAGTYYYSTSCGVGSDANVWRTEAAREITYLKAEAVNPSALQESEDIGLGEYLRDEKHFADFITTVNRDDYEADEGWYRWTYSVKKIDVEHMCEALQKRYQANGDLILTLEKGEYVSRDIEDFSEVHDIRVESRGAGGVADELVLETDSGVYKVLTEHNIRYVLCDGRTKVKRQNGSEVSMPNLLPSGFFILETGKEKGNVVQYLLTGGGFGHGVGMSQNAARAMADRGFTGEDILLFFYDRCSLQSIY